MISCSYLHIKNNDDKLRCFTRCSLHFILNDFINFEILTVASYVNTCSTKEIGKEGGWFTNYSTWYQKSVTSMNRIRQDLVPPESDWWYGLFGRALGQVRACIAVPESSPTQQEVLPVKSINAIKLGWILINILIIFIIFYVKSAL